MRYVTDDKTFIRIEWSDNVCKLLDRVTPDECEAFEWAVTEVLRVVLQACIDELRDRVERRR